LCCASQQIGPPMTGSGHKRPFSATYRWPVDQADRNTLLEERANN
jgi:hypothetical protein